MRNRPYNSYIDNIGAWKGPELASSGALYFDLKPYHLTTIDKALAKSNRIGVPIDEIDPSTFDLRDIGNDIKFINETLIRGTGIVILRGLPVDSYSLPDLEKLYWGLGSHFGLAVSQSVMGDRVGHVTDISGKDPNERAYRNSLAVPPHTDLADIVGMLSIRKAAKGGLSTYSSVLAIHNEIFREHPEYLPILYRGYRMHRFGEQSPGEPSVTPVPIPVLSNQDGYISARIVPEYIDMAEVELGEPLPPIQRAALDYFLELAERPDLCLSVMLEPGEISLINNYFILHSRTAFYDHLNSNQRRLLLRLWLVSNERRPVPPDFPRVEDSGILRQIDRKSSYFRGATARKANKGRYGED